MSIPGGVLPEAPLVRPDAKRTLVADVVARTLKNEGVDVVFGICGGFLFHLYAAFERAGIRTVPSRHEGAAAFSAAAWAQATGKVGVVFGQGPGTSNTITGVWAAFADSVPLLVIGGQAPQDEYCSDIHQESTGSNYGVDQVAAFKPMTKAAFRPPTAASFVRTIRQAISIATTERGPVMIDAHTNLLQEETDYEELPRSSYRVEQPALVDAARCAEVAAMIRAASRPALILGNRLTHRGLAEEVLALCEQFDLPFATSDYAKGLIPEDHPLCLGIAGYNGHESANAYLASSDLPIAIGMRLDHKSTVGFRDTLPGRLVQIDEIAREVGRTYPLRMGVIGDLPATIRGLRAALATGGSISAGRAAVVKEHLQQYHTFDEPLSHDISDTHISSPGALHILRRHIPRSALVVGDSGMNLHYLKRFFPMLSPDGFYCLYGWAAMGSGLPVAMGVQIARPDEVVICAIGDGGILTHVGELQVLAEYNLPVICLVFNNASYQQCTQYMTRFANSQFGSRIQEIDAAKIGEAFGCDGYTARTPEQVQDAITKAVERRRPTVIDLKVTGDHIDKLLNDKFFKTLQKTYAREVTAR